VHSVVLIRYGEIGLKSPIVRRNFEKKLRRNFVTQLRSTNIPFEKVVYDLGRFFIYTSKPFEISRFVSNYVFGVVSTSPCFEIESNLEAIEQGILTYAKSYLKENSNFALSTRRNGNHDFSSKDINILGGQIILDNLKERKLKVNLSNPDQTIYIEARQKSTFIYDEKFPGLGGLPGKTQGRSIGLIEERNSGLLAIWLAMRRGVHVDLFSINKSKKLSPEILNQVSILIKYVPEEEIFLKGISVPDIWKLVLKEKKEIQDIIWQAVIIKILNIAGKHRKSLGIILGDSLTEPSENTINSINMIDRISDLPLYRPLLILPDSIIDSLWNKIDITEEKQIDEKEIIERIENYKIQKKRFTQ